MIIKMLVIIWSPNKSKQKRTNTKHVENCTATLYIKNSMAMGNPFYNLVDDSPWELFFFNPQYEWIWDALYRSWTKLDVLHIFLIMPCISYSLSLITLFTELFAFQENYNTIYLWFLLSVGRSNARART